MRRNLAAYQTCQVFLNHPFDADFAPLADAMTFAVVAAGLLPVSALDLTVPDKPRLSILVDAIRNCRYSVHDLSRCTGEGGGNFSRMNMPIEMGMAMFYALDTQQTEHRCAFTVPTPHDYQTFASDLAGFDPICHNNNEEQLVTQVYEWLRAVVPTALFNSQPTVLVVEKYLLVRNQLPRLNGSGLNGGPSHDETREVMYLACAECQWWDWREHRLGKEEFPVTPLDWTRRQNE